MKTAEVTVRLSDTAPIRNLIETVEAAIGSLENGDHYSTQQDVADELRGALEELVKS